MLFFSRFYDIIIAMKVRKILIRIAIFIMIAVITVEILTELQENNAADIPPKTPAELSDISFPLQQDGYALLTKETGLMPEAITEIAAKEQNPLAVFKRYQRIYYQNPAYTCNGIAEMSSAERICGKENYYPFYNLLPGDVLLTKSTHTFFYRHGHSGLVLNKSSLLEASEIGMPASLRNPADWGGYPAVMQLRIKEEVAQNCGMTAAELGEAVAAYAEKELLGDDYSLLCGIGNIGIETNKTQCAYLIWEAFSHFGIDASHRKFPVTPKSLFASGVFEVVSYRGFTAPDFP